MIQHFERGGGGQKTLNKLQLQEMVYCNQSLHEKLTTNTHNATQHKVKQASKQKRREGQNYLEKV